MRTVILNLFPQKNFAKMFYTLRNQIKCVVLNCCYSAKTAKEIGKIVDCVIGFKNDIVNPSAIAFASG